MLRCEDCEFFSRLPDGSPQLHCDPFSTIKESECLSKWNLFQLRVIADSHEATLEMHRRFAPLQEKMFRHMEKEIDDMEDSESWKHDEDEAGEEKGDDDDDIFKL